MRRHLTGGWEHLVEFWGEAEKFSCDMVILNNDITCKGALGLTGVILDQAKTKKQHLMVGAAAGLYTDICEWDMEGESALRICITPKGIEEKPLDVSWRENLLRYRAAAVVPEDCELYDRILPDRIEKEPTGSTVNASFRIIQDGEYRWNAVSVRILSGEDGRRTAMNPSR